MSEIITPHSPEFMIHLPADPITWFVLIGWFLLIVFCLIFFQDRKRFYSRQNLIWLSMLSGLVLIVTPFFGLILFPNAGQQGNVQPINHFMFFSAVPWMVAVGVLGLIPAGLIAAISGLLLAYLDTHQIVTPLLFMTFSVIFSLAIRQSRRKETARVSRFPVIGALVTWLFSTPVVFISLMLTTQGSFGLRFASAFSNFSQVFLTVGAMLLIGGFAATLVWVFLPKFWQDARLLKPLRKICSSTRLMIQLTLIFLVFCTSIVVGVWRISEAKVRKILVEQLVDRSGLVAGGMDVFFNAGESQTKTLAEIASLANLDGEMLAQVLSQKIDSQNYFNLLAVFTPERTMVASYPSLQDGMVLPTAEEGIAISEAINEVSPRILTVPPIAEGQNPQVSFIIGLKVPEGQPKRVLLARTQFVGNQIATPIMSYMRNFENRSGVVQIIDGQNKRFYHTNPDLHMTDYFNPRFTTTTFFERTILDEQVVMMSYQPIRQEGWAVVTAFQNEARHLMTWDFAQPIFLLGFVGSLFLLFTVFLRISPLAHDLGQLKAGIRSIVEAQRPSKAVEDMREKANYEEIILKRIESLNRRVQLQRDLLRIVSLKTNKSNLKSELSQVMKAALAQGVSSVRIVFGPQVNKDFLGTQQRAFGLGRDTRVAAQIDSQVALLVEKEGPIILQDFLDDKRLYLPDGLLTPASLMAFPLRSEENWFGVMWVTFPEKRYPAQEEVDFFEMLSQRAVDILANKTLMEEMGLLEKRMAAVLDELPQAVLLIDEAGRVVYHNRRFLKAIDSPTKSLIGGDIVSIFPKFHPAELVSAIERGETTKEIKLDNGSVLRCRLMPIDVSGMHAGLALLIEPFKGGKANLDASNELVTMVSHALRSPLTLIHGYAKILRLTGNLNDQQDDYTVKIIKGIEEMRSLVQNLLEVRRLESLGVMDFSEFHVSQVLQKITESMEAQFRQKNIKLVALKPDEPIFVWADFTLLTQALKNLVDNALKFTKMGGKVSIKVWQENEQVVFSVNDTGPGIAPLDQRHIFEKFQLGEKGTREEPSGGGLGLAIVRSIVEYHNGRVWLESQLGQGSTFYFEIPKYQSEKGG